MKGPPPYLVRRLILAPAMIGLAVVAVVVLPFWVIGAAFVSRYVPGRWRALRVMWFAFLYVVLEALMLVVLLATWIASGFGWKVRSPRFVALHYALAAWWLRRVMASARRTFHLELRDDGTGTPGTMVSTDRPTLVFPRHAGPGDSFLIVDAVLNSYGRNPRIVLKDLLQFDPCIDVVLSRVPSKFVPSSGRAGDPVVDAIGELAGGMEAGDAFVMFPEGGNFTERRRVKAIEKLDEIGRPELADRARDLRHLLPPKPTGTLTAIEASPTADVVFVGHVGLEQFVTLGDLWRGIPMDSVVFTRLWRYHADEIPPPDQRETWLYDQWALIDAWIQSHLDA